METYLPNAKQDDLFCRVRNRLKATSRIFLLLIQELQRRLYSSACYYVIRRDLSLNIEVTPSTLGLSMRRLNPLDIPLLLDIWKPGLSTEGIRERIRIRRMISSGIQTPYVVITKDGRPCHLAWYIDPSENENLLKHFKNRIIPLREGDVLFEFVFTLEEFRGRGIQVWRSLQFTDKAVGEGARWAFGYIKQTNGASLHNARANAFEIYAIRKDQWRFFRCKSQWTPYNKHD